MKILKILAAAAIAAAPMSAIAQDSDNDGQLVGSPPPKTPVPAVTQSIPDGAVASGVIGLIVIGGGVALGAAAGGGGGGTTGTTSTTGTN